MPRRTWLRTLGNTPRTPAARLVCFPHSGGSAGGFLPWADALPPGTHLLAAQYPGRADRLAEPPVPDVRAMSAALAGELLALAPLPSVLLGHSLGALVAFETALALQAAGHAPHRLCVSGCKAPAGAAGGGTHRAPDDELWSAVAGLGGVAPDLEDDHELRELLLPALRSDVTAHETYRPTSGRLHCPVDAFRGADDPLVGAADLAGWAAVTSGRLVTDVRPGGHFYVGGTADLAAAVTAVLPMAGTGV
ncbi:thioesterase II family protein [Streptomyces sp. NPDC059578]|uniref:thioesterase II family protein n=1 Tax=Streptomyces sp. NPDC059578 TaxID=3346874 RepID=UPI0036B639F5